MLDFSALLTLFSEKFQRSPTILASAPGRINLAGEHVDYNEGIVLPVAIDRYVYVVAAPTEDETVTILAHNLGETVAFRLDRLEGRLDVNGEALPSWALYPAGVAWVLQEAGYPITGMQAVLTGDLPVEAGLGSSAAVEVAFAVAWQALGGWTVDPLTLARLCQQAENRYVGVNCGLMDQFISVCGIAGHALRFDTRSLEWEPLLLPAGTAIVIADTSLRRSLTSIEYNERRVACEQAVSILCQYLPGMKSLRDISSVEFAAYSDFLPPEIRKRAEHVVIEMMRVNQAINCLRRGDIRYFGGLMYASHNSLRELYEVSCPEIDYLVEISRKLPGCYGARLSGAGFGGCTVNLVEEGQAQAFMRALQQRYKRRTGRQAVVYLCHASQGAMVHQLGAPDS